MHHLQLLAWGQIIVLLDFRIEDIDIMPDPLGWGMSMAAMATLAKLHRGFVAAGWVSMVGIVASLPGWVNPDALAPLLEVILGVLTLVLVVATCTAIAETLPERAATARSVRTWTLMTTALLVVGILLATLTPDVTALLLVVGIVALGVHVWFLVLLFSAARLPRPSVASGRSSRGGPAVA